MIQLALLGLLGLNIAVAQLEVPPSPSSLTESIGGFFMGRLDPFPEVSSTWDVVASNPVVAVHLAHMPGGDNYVFLGRPQTSPTSYIYYVAGSFNLQTREWKNLTLDDNPFCGGQVLSADGQLVVVGGNGSSVTGLADGLSSIRLYNPSNDSTHIYTKAKMHYPRWYSSNTLMPSGNILTMGGTQTASTTGKATPFFEIWNPRTPETKPTLLRLEPTFYSRGGKIFYPFNFVLPTGDLFSHVNGETRFLTQTGAYRTIPGTNQTMTGPTFPAGYGTQYPRTATAVIGPLRHSSTGSYTSVDIFIFGGAPTSNKCAKTVQDSTTPANKVSFKLTISWAGTGRNLTYSFGTGWEMEEMPTRRVGGDSVLLPNGDIILINGLQAGCMGDTTQGQAYNSYPNMWPVLYQSDKPAGQRYTLLKASQIMRNYHSTATLTSEGMVLVAGCDQCRASQIAGKPGFVSATAQRWEYRVELFRPPYTLDEQNKPVINAINKLPIASGSVIQLQHNKQYTLTYAGENVPTAITIIPPNTVTHSFSTNSRVVFCRITKTDRKTKTITFRLPGQNIAPSQMYMLFALNGKTYGKSAWVSLRL